MTCPLGSLPDSNRTQCEEIPEVYLRADSGWAIGVMSFSSVGIVLTSLVRPNLEAPLFSFLFFFDHHLC